ncbi:MAG TPA: SRPBCC family protein [Chitinophagaceae bacterium]|nr:SRPBCC family protein [Chitinophagaceae bacterium]
MKPINKQAPVSCIRSIRISAAPAPVWELLSDINKWPAWQPDISRAALHGDLAPATGFSWKTGGASIRSILHTVEPGHGLGWTGKTMGMQAIHNWTLHPVAGGTEVRVEESLEGWLVVLLRRMFQKNLEQGMDRWLRYLKQAAEQPASQPV